MYTKRYESAFDGHILSGGIKHSFVTHFSRNDTRKIFLRIVMSMANHIVRTMLQNFFPIRLRFTIIIQDTIHRRILIRRPIPIFLFHDAQTRQAIHQTHLLIFCLRIFWPRFALESFLIGQERFLVGAFGMEFLRNTNIIIKTRFLHHDYQNVPPALGLQLSNQELHWLVFLRSSDFDTPFNLPTLRRTHIIRNRITPHPIIRHNRPFNRLSRR